MSQLGHTIKLLRAAGDHYIDRDQAEAAASLLDVAVAMAKTELHDAAKALAMRRLRALLPALVKDTTSGVMDPVDRHVLQLYIRSNFEIIAATIGDHDEWEWGS
jgi:hypothetical protein